MQTTHETYPVGVSIERRAEVRHDVERWAPLIGRIFISAIFLTSGLAKITDLGATVSYMQAKGIPAAEVLAVLAAVVEVGAGVALLIGLWTRWSAVVLALYLIPVTIIFHPFWAYAGMEQRTQMINFLKNLAIMGGLAYVATYGAGLLGIDARRRSNVAVHSRPTGRPFARQPIGS